MAYISIHPTDHFKPKIYTGNGTAFGSGGNAITGIGFEPSFTWIKSRGAGEEHVLTDAVRGTTKIIRTNSTAAESTASEGLNTFGSDGFTIGNSDQFNTNSGTYVSYSWKGGGAGSANSDGSISATVSANAAAGFSIVKYTGTGSAGTIGHGLSSAPTMIIQKNLADTENWQVYHTAFGATKYMLLNSVNSSSSNTARWNDTAPTASVFSIGTDSSTNGSGEECIAYCFANVKGFSKHHFYMGNGDANGQYAYTGFKPDFVMLKNRHDGASGDEWFMIDSARSTYNPTGKKVSAHLSNAETAASWVDLDFLATGFKIRTDDAGLNEGGDVFLYMAFAQEPLVTSTGLAATAN